MGDTPPRRSPVSGAAPLGDPFGRSCGVLAASIARCVAAGGGSDGGAGADSHYAVSLRFEHAAGPLAWLGRASAARPELDPAAVRCERHAGSARQGTWARQGSFRAKGLGRAKDGIDEDQIEDQINEAMRTFLQLACGIRGLSDSRERVEERPEHRREMRALASREPVSLGWKRSTGFSSRMVPCSQPKGPAGSFTL